MTSRSAFDTAEQPGTMAYTDYDSLEQVIHQKFGTRAWAFNDVLGTTITHQSHYSSPVSSPCSVIVTEEHFRTPETELEAPMDESEDQQPEVPASCPGFRKRWASKVTMTPWTKKRPTTPVAEKRHKQIEIVRPWLLQPIEKSSPA